MLQGVKGGYRPFIPADCPELIVTLMRKCWAAEPADRITAEDLTESLVWGVFTGPCAVGHTTPSADGIQTRPNGAPRPVATQQHLSGFSDGLGVSLSGNVIFDSNVGAVDGFDKSVPPSYRGDQSDEGANGSGMFSSSY
jgi:hypothetical protein